MNTKQRIVIFAPERGTLSYLSDELESRGHSVEWWPAESWHCDIFRDVQLVVLDLVDWEFENRECVRTLHAHLIDQQDRPFPVVMLVRPDISGLCTCGKNLCRTLFHPTDEFLNIDDLAAIGESTPNLTDLLFELTHSSTQNDWERSERALLRLAVSRIRIPGCDEALMELRQHHGELGHRVRVDIVGDRLVCETI